MSRYRDREGRTYVSAPCPGSGQPAMNGKPNNVDRWGTCPVCGSTITSSAVVMADHDRTTEE